MNAKTKAAVQAHGENLKRIFPKCNLAPVDLCRKLRRLEREGESLGLRLCNGPELDEAEAEKITDLILARADKLLNFRASGVPVFVNRDPRGYALKIESDWMDPRSALHRDWGGYGILAPDLSS